MLRERHAACNVAAVGAHLHNPNLHHRRYCVCFGVRQRGEVRAVTDCMTLVLDLTTYYLLLTTTYYLLLLTTFYLLLTTYYLVHYIRGARCSWRAPGATYEHIRAPYKVSNMSTYVLYICVAPGARTCRSRNSSTAPRGTVSASCVALLHTHRRPAVASLQTCA